MKSELELLIPFFSFPFLSLIENILAHCLNSLLLLNQNQAVKRKKQVVFYYSLLIIVYHAFERKTKFIISHFLFFNFGNFQTFSSVQFSCSVVSDSLRPHESQHARPPCPSPTSQSLLRLMSIQSGDAIQPSYPLSSPSPPAPNPSQHQSLFQ